MDGKLDILSGCYWTAKKDGGYIQMLEGVGKLDFKKATDLLSAADKPLLNVVIQEDDAGGMAPNQTKTICTQQHAVDYDGDGDLDLIVGCFDKNFYYYENEGDDKENRLVEKPVEMELTSPDNHSAPHLVDFDGDGDLDFLTGGSAGGVYIAINDGTREQPRYGDFKVLLGKPESGYGPQLSDSIGVGGGTRLWATDFNGDGLMDLLIGDKATVILPAKGLSDEDYEKKKVEHKNKLARLKDRKNSLSISGRKWSVDVYDTYIDILRDYEKSPRKFERSESTGFVWLLLQKPKSGTGKDVTQN